MKRALAGLFLFSAGLFFGSVGLHNARAQVCNSNSGFVQLFGTFNIGDILILGPDCNHAIDGGASATGFYTTRTNNYTAAPTDCGNTVILAGLTQFTFTVGAAAGFPANCMISVRNSDTIAAGGHGKKISIAGGVVFPFNVLYPQMSFKLFGNGASWSVFDLPDAWRIPQSMTFFVATTGSDSNDGLAATTPWATLAAGGLIPLQDMDAAGLGGSITTQFACGTYNGILGSDMLHYSGRMRGTQGGKVITFNGCDGTAEDTQFISNGGAVFSVNTGAILSLNNISMGTTLGDGSTCLSASDLSKIYLNNISFHWCDGNTMFVSNWSIIEIDGPLQLRGIGGPMALEAGTNGAVVRAASGGLFTGASTFTFNAGNTAFFNWFVLSNAGQVFYTPTFTLNGFAFTGPAGVALRYTGNNLGLISNGGCAANFYPGNTPGVLTDNSVCR